MVQVHLLAAGDNMHNTWEIQSDKFWQLKTIETHKSEQQTRGISFLKVSGLRNCRTFFMKQIKTTEHFVEQYVLIPACIQELITHVAADVQFLVTST